MLLPRMLLTISKIQTKAGVDLIIVNQVKLMRQFVDGAKH
jgi:hypothetical protein